MRLGGEYEESLSREELETVLRETVLGIAVVAPHSGGVKLVYTNDGFFQIFGYTREEYEELGEDVRLNLFNQDDFRNIIMRVNADYAPGETSKFECRINKKDGTQPWVLISTRKPRNAKKEDRAVVCSIVDIDDAKNLQFQLQKEKNRYEIIEDLSDNIIFNYDVINDTFEASSKILRSLGTRTKFDNVIENITYGSIIDHRDVPAVIGALSNALS